jgi:hypothetical protein
MPVFSNRYPQSGQAKLTKVSFNALAASIGQHTFYRET